MPAATILSPGFTKKDLFLAAIRAQIVNYKTTTGDGEEEQNTSNARLFESPEVVEEKEGTIAIATATHDSQKVDDFNQLTKKTPQTDDWAQVSEKYPFQLNEGGAVSINLAVSTKQQLADYHASFIDLFQKVWPEIESILHEKNDLVVSSELILSLAVFLKTMLTPDLTAASMPDNLRNIYGLLSNIDNKITNLRYMTPPPSNTIDRCCEAMLRLVSLTITPPIGEEIACGGLLGTVEKYMPQKLLEDVYGTSEYQEFTWPNSYTFPELCFNYPENTSEDEFLWQFLSLNKAFFIAILLLQHHVDLCKITVQRLWDGFTQNEKCPARIKNNTDALKEKISNLNLTFLILLDNIEQNINNQDIIGNDSLQLFLSSNVQKILGMLKLPEVELNQQLANLYSVYQGKRNLHEIVCSHIISQTQSIAQAVIAENKHPEEGSTVSETIEKFLEKSDSLKEISTSVAKSVVERLIFTTTTRKEKIHLFYDLLKIKDPHFISDVVPSMMLQLAKYDCTKELLILTNSILPEKDEASQNVSEEEIELVKHTINKIKNSEVKGAMLTIIENSNLPYEKRLLFIGHIAEGRNQRSVVRNTYTREVYNRLRIFSENSSDQDFNNKLIAFKESRIPSPIGVFGIWSRHSSSQPVEFNEKKSLKVKNNP